MMIRAILLALVLAISDTAFCKDLGTGRLPIHFNPFSSFVAHADEEIRISGMVKGPANATIVLRVDDSTSGDYASRYNEERTLPPGPFRWTVGLRGLRTPAGRDIDLSALKRIFLFSTKDSSEIIVTGFSIEESPKLPRGAAGYSFGAKTSPLLPGFSRVLQGDPIIEAGKAIPIRRPGPDPLLASGMRALERVRLPAPRGRVRLTLWLEDPGDWSDLAHPLERGIRVNGQWLLKQRLTPADWVEQRYLRNKMREHTALDDAWTAYGTWRGDRRGIEVDVADDGLLLELEGGTADELYISAALVESDITADAVAYVEGLRAEWLRTTWPISAPTKPRLDQRPIRIGEVPSPLRIKAAPGSGVHLRFAVEATRRIEDPEFRVSPPMRDGMNVGIDLWAGQRRLERLGAADTILQLSDNTLISSLGSLPIESGEPRSYDAWVTVPENARAGLYTGDLSISEHQRELIRIPFEVEIIDVQLPPSAKPAGFYLDEAPHLTWFKELRPQRRAQIDCDLSFMRSLGLTGSAPALATPFGDGGDFIADASAAERSGLASPWLAYAPAKRMRQEYGTDRSAERLATISEALRSRGIMPPIWSVADEPSNAGHSDSGLQRWMEAIRRSDPRAKLGAQLNSPKDMAKAALFDVVLVNDGLGLDRNQLTELSRSSEVWAYNTAAHRLTAGLWLWSMPVTRYLQWHARMPTADPFDPTDGREGDVQMLFPGKEACPARPDIHRHLLEMATGVVDQRWLQWLASRQEPRAKSLLQQILSKLPDNWRDARKISGSDLQAIRESIMALAAETH